MTEDNLSGEPFSSTAHKGGALHQKQFHHQSRQWRSGLVEVIKPKVGRQVETPNGRNVDGQETESQKTEQSKRRRVELAKLEIPKVMLPNEWSKYRQSYYRMVETSNGQNTESQNVNSEPRRDKRLLDQ
ncbi:hypothetical protein M513_00548 [Trichuris suis]|uniref:Uncharacterized protein n=1 Tax=Trichuris suis TaxID=68888 RepID=A0A085MM76_9BILA|nr:hypothetical protein M513_00548 [Trichuris suis]